MSVIFFILFIGIFNKYSYGNLDVTKYPLNDDISNELKSVSSADEKSSCSDDETCFANEIASSSLPDARDVHHSSNHIVDGSSKDICDGDDLTCPSSDVVDPSKQTPDKILPSPARPACLCGLLCCPNARIHKEDYSTNRLDQKISIENENLNQDESSNVVYPSDQTPHKSHSPPDVLGCSCCGCDETCCPNGACCSPANCLARGTGCST